MQGHSKQVVGSGTVVSSIPIPCSGAVVSSIPIPCSLKAQIYPFAASTILHAMGVGVILTSFTATSLLYFSPFIVASRLLTNFVHACTLKLQQIYCTKKHHKNWSDYNRPAKAM